LSEKIVGFSVFLKLNICTLASVGWIGSCRVSLNALEDKPQKHFEFKKKKEINLRNKIKCFVKQKNFWKQKSLLIFNSYLLNNPKKWVSSICNMSFINHDRNTFLLCPIWLHLFLFLIVIAIFAYISSSWWSLKGCEPFALNIRFWLLIFN
jgi:hypothetical protein